MMTLSALPEIPTLTPVVPPDDVNSSSFRCVEVLEHVSLLPCYVGRLSEGIIKHLNKKIFCFSKQLGGILLSYSKPLVLQRHGAILDEQPHVHFDLKYSAYIFKPQIGSILSGVVNNVGGDYIGCLVHSCFNASVVQQDSQEKVVGTSEWFSSDIGSTIWFKVTNLENVGGVVSIVGEHWNFNDLDELTELSGLSEDISMSQSNKSKSEDSSSSCATTKMDITSPKKKTPKQSVKLTDSKLDKRNRKRKRTEDASDSVSTNILPRPKFLKKQKSKRLKKL